MIVYFDTSSLIKRYLAEPGSSEVGELWTNAEQVAASQLLYAEMAATFARKRREQQVAAALIDVAKEAFRADWDTFDRISLDDDVNQRVDALLKTHSLRGADAVHLASALILRELLNAEVTFACADAALNRAAAAEGLKLAP